MTSYVIALLKFMVVLVVITGMVPGAPGPIPLIGIGTGVEGGGGVEYTYNPNPFSRSTVQIFLFPSFLPILATKTAITLIFQPALQPAWFLAIHQVN